MRILYLLFSFATGGTERLVTDICNEMVSRNHTVHLYVVNDLYDESMLQALDQKVQVCLQKRTVGGGDKLATLWKVTQYIRQNSIDVVHCNSFDAPELLLFRPLLFPKTKVVHMIHDVGQFGRLGKMKRIYRNLMCNRIVAISDCVKQDVVNFGASPDKVCTVYNAIDLTRFSPQDKAGNLDCQICLGNVARIMPEKKGQDILLHAAGILCKKYPQLKIFFAGDADAAHRDALFSLKELAMKLGIADRVVFLGNVEDVPAFLSTLDIFVLPSRYEGFGISLIEAMAMGIPCVASRLDGPAEVLKNGQFGLLFEPNDPQDLAKKIDHMLMDYTKYKTAAEKTIAYVRAQYNIVNMCDQLETVMNYRGGVSSGIE